MSARRQRTAFVPATPLLGRSSFGCSAAISSRSATPSTSSAPRPAPRAVPRAAMAMDSTLPTSVIVTMTMAVTAFGGYFTTARGAAMKARGALDHVYKTGFTNHDVGNYKRVSDIVPEVKPKEPVAEAPKEPVEEKVEAKV